MDTKALLVAIDEEIARLEQVKALLGIRGSGAGKATSFALVTNRTRKPRKLSAKAIAAIRKAQKKRWAAWHKTHPKKAAAQ